MALSGRDLIAISETGSGKTLAYAASAIVHIAAQTPTKPTEGPIVLILAPTRELATQILRECQALGKGGNVRSACAYGGVPRGTQLADIRAGVDILIACPGRLLDFLAAGDLSLERVTYFVLDEADRMISLGFEKEVRQIISMIRPDRQTLMFSATFPAQIRSIAREFYRNAITVKLGLDVVSACSDIEQRVEVVRNYHQKTERLYTVLVEEVAPVNGKALIFVNQRRAAVELTDWLRNKSIEAISLHGEKQQPERDFALSEFRAGSIPCLVATDVAQRGLDVPDVSIVINFDPPTDGASSYVHRIGRTGRAGHKGKALTFFGPKDTEAADNIIQVLATNNVEVPQELQELANGGGFGSFRRSFGDSAPRAPAQSDGWNSNATDTWGGGSSGAAHDSQVDSTQGGGGATWGTDAATPQAPALASTENSWGVPPPSSHDDKAATAPTASSWGVPPTASREENPTPVAPTFASPVNSNNLAAHSTPSSPPPIRPAPAHNHSTGTSTAPTVSGGWGVPPPLPPLPPSESSSSLSNRRSDSRETVKKYSDEDDAKSNDSFHSSGEHSPTTAHDPTEPTRSCSSGASSTVGSGDSPDSTRSIPIPQRSGTDHEEESWKNEEALLKILNGRGMGIEDRRGEGESSED